MFKFILLGIYILSVAVFAFLEISIARTALRHAKKIMKKDGTIRLTPVSLLRVILISLIPVINTVFASILLLCYEGFEDNAIQTINNHLIKEKKVPTHGIIDTEQNKEGNKMNAWELNAKTVKEIYGGYVDYEERFYICPNCEEPVYEEDWSEETMTAFMCPYCEEPLYEEE